MRSVTQRRSRRINAACTRSFISSLSLHASRTPLAEQSATKPIPVQPLRSEVPPPSSPAASKSTTSLSGMLDFNETFLGSPTPFRHQQLDRSRLESLATHPLTHSIPSRLSDHVCIRLVKVLRWVADRCFRESMVHRGLMLKCINSAAPSAALFAERLRSSFRYVKSRPSDTQGSGGSPSSSSSILWERARTQRVLANASECHYLHALMILQFTKLSVAERLVFLVAQALHFVLHLVVFIVAPRFGYRLMGYALEESTVILTHMINDIDMDKVPIPQPPALPSMSLAFWGLEKHFYLVDPELVTVDSTGLGDPSTLKPASTLANSSDERVLTLRDWVLLMRGDEMFYRDAMHCIANRMDAARDNQNHSGAPSTAFR